MVGQFVRKRKSQEVHHFPPTNSRKIGILKLSINASATIGKIDRKLFKSVETTEGPTPGIRGELRKLKPEKVSCCENCKLIGHGWRHKTIYKKSWGKLPWTELWYWRLLCKNCGSVHCVFFTFCCLNLTYAFDVVAGIVVSALTGDTSLKTGPSRRSRSRWISRFRFNWSLLEGRDIISKPLLKWTPSINGLKSIIRKCWNLGALLFASNPLQ